MARQQVADIPITGGFNQQRSPILANQQCKNLYRLIDPTNGTSMLCSQPGSYKSTNFDGLNPAFTGRWHGMIAVENVVNLMFVIIGDRFFTVTTNEVLTEVGVINTTTGKVKMTVVGQFVNIVDGANQYKYDYINDVFTTTSSPYAPLNPTYITSLSGYVLTNNRNTQELYQTTLYSGDQYFALGRIDVNYKDGPLLAMEPVNGRIFCFATNFIQTLENAKKAGFTFRENPDLIFDYGLVSSSLLALGGGGLQNQQQPAFLIFVTSANGLFKVMMTTGNPPTIISTPAVDRLLSQLTNPTDGIANIYSMNGQTFYEASWTQDNVTLLYNVGSREWYTKTYLEGRSFIESTCFFNGKTYAVSNRDAGLYVITENLTTQNGYPMRNRWVGPNFRVDGYRAYTVDRIVFWFQQGVGLAGDDLPDTAHFVFGAQPTLDVYGSNDNGVTFRPIEKLSLGGTGLREHATTVTVGGAYRTFTPMIELNTPNDFYLTGVQIYYTIMDGTT